MAKRQPSSTKHPRERRRREPEPDSKRALSLGVVGLFSGVGGFELGFERAGHQTLVLCEIMPEARAVLQAAKRRPASSRAFMHAKLEADVRSSELTRSIPERFEILAAGFPCQDLSQAGRAVGIRGLNSGLIQSVLSILSRRRGSDRPRWVVLENVPFMRHLGGGHGMEAVLSGLSKLGYSWAYREIDALAFGLPQRRKRLFIVACRRGEGDPRSILLSGVGPRRPPSRGAGWLDGRACGFYWTEGNTGLGWADDAVPTLKGGSSIGIPSPPAIVLPDGQLVLPLIRDAERLQGFPPDWTAAAVNGRGDRKRWTLVGNAVSVRVAEWLGRRFAKPQGDYDASQDTPLSSESKWPSAGWRMSSHSRRFSSMANDWPVEGGKRITLLELLSFERTARTPLSNRAASGFLQRFRASNLLKGHPDHRHALIDVLERHIRGGKGHGVTR